jgi:membrane protein DedA with SNARE-associated domain
VTTLAVNPLDPASLIATFGLIGVLIALFAETGLLVGFFLPGDTLLFSAGFFASQGKLSFAGLLVGAPVFAIAGAQVGHYLGVKAGPALFARPDSRLFRQERLEKAAHYFERFGPARAVVLARFVPVLRTFLNPVAGVLGMSARRFFVWNVVGGVLWTEGVLILGHYLGKKVPSIDKYILPVVALAVLGSLVPVAYEVLRGRKQPATDGSGDDVLSGEVPKRQGHEEHRVGE